jgi:muramoyltetrapeptide carboxypeptidase
MPSRRTFITTGASAAAAVAAGARVGAQRAAQPIVKPKRLRAGDTVGLIDPASAIFRPVVIDIVSETMAALGLKVKRGRHLLDRYGYLAGRDEDRAADINALFADDEVDGIVAVRGGWGSARLLPRLDYDAIRRHPKPLIGYSDITALHLAIHAKTRLVVFHGPVGGSGWNAFNTGWVKRVLFDGEAVTFENVKEFGDNLAQVDHRVQTITSGRARGRIVGGNLTVLSAIVGSPYLPDWDGAILFLEDVGEDIYRVDRMLTQLALAGILGRIRGFVFGTCDECGPGEGYGSLTLEEVLADHIRPLKVPAWQGAMIGHIDRQFTIPIGVDVEIDADRGTIRMLESAVA